jgi:nucleotide-binding universal stress UspA family protein
MLRAYRVGGPSIIHPTDFSDASMEAFAHAMAFSLAVRSRLYILHVARDGEDDRLDELCRDTQPLIG